MRQTLLLADDSLTIQRVIELTFADEDIEVVAVSDGDQAIERLESTPPDIVLADVGMPGRNGYEVAKYVKQSPKLAHIPVVLLTGAFEPVDQARAAQAGCDGVLAKPFEPQLVIGRVKELLARPRHLSASLDADVAPPPAATPEKWTPPLVDESFGGQADKPAEPVRVEDYFDRLDAAFATLSATPRDTPKQATPLPEVPDEIDWYGAKSQLAAPAEEKWDLNAPVSTIEPVDLPLAYTASQAPDAAPLPPPEAATPAQSAPITLPPIGDAFAALLAAEQNEPLPAAALTWPTQMPAGSVDPRDLVERVTELVLDRLSDRVVGEKVTDIVSKIAERLIRDEIERIKASIR